MTKALSNGERVELRDLMTFETKIQKKRISLNPKTLEKVDVPEKKSIIFKCSKEWKKILKSTTLKKYSKQYKIDPVLMTALIHVESNWKAHVVSYAGACGLTQVIPKYSRGYTCEQLKDPDTSIRVGSRIFSYWYYKYSKRKSAVALCGYNAGFRCKGAAPNKYGVSYAKKVLKIAKRIRRKIK